jgi:hypothetical protein
MTTASIRPPTTCIPWQTQVNVLLANPSRRASREEFWTGIYRDPFEDEYLNMIGQRLAWYIHALNNLDTLDHPQSRRPSSHRTIAGIRSKTSKSRGYPSLNERTRFRKALAMSNAYGEGFYIASLNPADMIYDHCMAAIRIVGSAQCYFFHPSGLVLNK